MRRVSFFILERETALANLIRYRLMMQQAEHVQVFPALSECLYFMQKHFVPDFIIADLDLPEMNGSRFLTTVKELSNRIQVVFLSAHPDDVLLSQLMEEGASDYIFKSAQREEWIRELMKNLEYLSRTTTPAIQG
ncbi:MAG: response regulator [Bacteroidetes bacterium]|nr:response regulator [Bacteroidota bacterium]